MCIRDRPWRYRVGWRTGRFWSQFGQPLQHLFQAALDPGHAGLQDAFVGAVQARLFQRLSLIHISSNQFEAGGFIRTRPEFAWPNIQFHFLPVAINYNGSNAVNEHGFQAHVGSMRSPSRGRIQLLSLIHI